MENRRKDEFLDALLEEIRERGAQKVTLEEVGDRLGVSKSAVYHYFDGKAHMLRSLMVREFGRLHARMEQAAESVRDPARKLEAVVRARLGFFTHRGGAATWSLDNLLSVAPLARELQPSFHESERDLLASILRQGRDRGVFDVEDIDTTADILVSALHSLEESLLTKRKPAALKKVQAAATRLWLSGLQAR